MTAAGGDSVRPDLVLLHGWGTNQFVWRELADRLAVRFRVHVPALPFSLDRGTHDTQTVDAIAAQIAAAAPRHCMVCGWSLGGAIAIAWARRAPAQVTRLALIATNASFVQRSDWRHALHAWTVREFARRLTRETAAVLARYIALQARGDARAARVARFLRQTLSGRFVQPETGALHAGLRLLLRTDLRSALPEVAQPVLLLHGARDAVVPLEAGEYLAGAFPDARLSVMPGAAHAPFASDPEEAHARLTSFFDGR